MFYIIGNKKSNTLGQEIQVRWFNSYKELKDNFDQKVFTLIL